MKRALAPVLLALLCMPDAAFAAPTADDVDVPKADDAERLREAKALFHEGNVQRKAGDNQAALELYLRSRALVPSMPNTMNAALCLEQLGRDDEALALYEEILVKFRDELDADEKQELSATMSALRRQLASIDVAGTVGGMVLIDGKPRGTLPLAVPLHVRPGPHLVRVLKEGWEPFETKVVAVRGQTVPVDVRLSLLLHAGRLRVDADTPSAANESGAEVIIDGATLGTVPWEGTLAPGSHLVAIRKGTLGTAPTQAIVVEGQLVTVRLHAVPVGPEMRVFVEPSTADMWIDGVRVGKGEWRGRLPLGSHLIEAREVGYVSASVTRKVAPSMHAEVALTLAIDFAHPRWARPPEPHGVMALRLYGGAALGISLGSGASARCDRATCPSESWVTGGLFGLRAVYTFPSGLFVQGGAGYMTLRQRIERRIDSAYEVESGGPEVGVSYAVEDALRVSGPFFSGGAGFARKLGTGRLTLHGALDLGVFVTAARDTMQATASGEGRTLDVSIAQNGAPAYAAAPFLLPEVGLTLSLGPFDATATLGAALFPFNGPTLPTGEARVYGASCPANPGTVDCAPGKTIVAHERGYTQLALVIPTLGLGRRF